MRLFVGSLLPLDHASCCQLRDSDFSHCLLVAQFSKQSPNIWVMLSQQIVYLVMPAFQIICRPNVHVIYIPHCWRKRAILLNILWWKPRVAEVIKQRKKCWQCSGTKLIKRCSYQQQRSEWKCQLLSHLQAGCRILHIQRH